MPVSSLPASPRRAALRPLSTMIPVALALMSFGAHVHADSAAPSKSAPSKAGAHAASPVSSVRSLTLDEAVGIALQQNPDIRRAKQEIERTRGVIIQVRAQALPTVAGSGAYDQLDQNLVESRGTAGTNIMRDKSFVVAIEARQLLYSGGQVRAALNIAKLTRDSSLYSLQDSIDRVVALVRQEFSEVLLNRSLIVVQEESIKLLEGQLTDQKSRFDAGTVPRFNVLRAEVELANVVPELIRARNNYLLARLRLAKTLALEASGDQAPVDARGTLEGGGAVMALSEALNEAREKRSSLKAQRQNLLIESEQIKVALAGYLPKVSATAGYRAQNSALSDQLDDTIDGWFVGLQGTWNIFDGLETHGLVVQARARLETARINYQDGVQQVELEVQQAYARVNEARQLMDSQNRVIEQAQEALRLATERLDAGSGTQLDVLDARVALTRSQVTELQARYDYNFAVAEFDRAVASGTRFSRTVIDPLLPKTKAASKDAVKPAKVAR